MEETEGSAIEAAFLKASEKYRRLEANIPGVVYVYALYPDGHHGFPYINEGSRDLFSLEPEAVMRDGTLLSGLIHPDDRQRRDESIQQSARTLQPWRQELRHIVNREVRWYDCMSRPGRQPDGTILWDGIMLEITARKRADSAVDRRLAIDEALVSMSTWLIQPGNSDQRLHRCLADLGKLTQARWVTLFLAPDGSTVMDPVSRWAAKEASAQPDVPSLVPCDRFSWWTARLLDGGIVHIRDAAKMPAEAKAEREYLERRHLTSIVIVPVRIRGEMKGLISMDDVEAIRDWSGYDLTSLQVAAEMIGSTLARRWAEEATRRSEALYRSLVAMSPSAITVTDLDGRILMANPRSLEIFGFTEDSDVIGHPIFEWVPPEESEHAAQIFAGLLAQGIIKHARGTLWRRNGEPFAADMSGSVVRAPDGRPWLLMLMVTDLSEQ